MTPSDAHRTVEAVWRLEAGRIIGALARMIGDVGLAEEFAQDALVAALEQWPNTGVPANPGAWLTLAAKRRAIDRVRRLERLHAKQADLADLEADRLAANENTEIEQLDTPGPDDDLLRLIFIGCHPVLSREAQLALTLRLLGGLSTEQIAAAFFVPEPTIAQRIVRAKRTLSQKKIPFQVPPPDEQPARLSAVLQVIYLIFNEGYATAAGPEWMRVDLCQEAVRLARVLATLAPEQAEVHGLVALLELQLSRARARTDLDGNPIPLPEQDRGLWDQLLIRRGYAALLRAGRVADQPGPYMLQAAIAACHAQARTAGETDWVQVAGLYQALEQLTPTPVVRLNQAVAISMARGPAAGLERIEALRDEPTLQHYYLLPTVRGDLLSKLGRHAEAVAEFERAAALTANERVRTVALARAATAREHLRDADRSPS